MTSTMEVVDGGRRITFSFADIMKHHGPGSGGVARAFKVLQRALPLLEPDDPCERREIVMETAFGGPGARDAFEMVTRAVTGDRFRVNAALARPERGRALERFAFRLGCCSSPASGTATSPVSPPARPSSSTMPTAPMSSSLTPPAATPPPCATPSVSSRTPALASR